MDDPSQLDGIETLLKHDVVQRYLNASIRIESVNSDYAMTMMASNDCQGSRLDQDISIHYNLNDQQILLTFVSHDNNIEAKDKLITFKSNLAQCLSSLSNFVQSS